MKQQFHAMSFLSSIAYKQQKCKENPAFLLFDFIYFDFVSVNILHKYTLCKYSSLFYVLPSKLCNSISIQMAISFKINIIYPSEPCDPISIQMFCTKIYLFLHPSEPCDPISIQMVIIYTQGDIVRCLLALVRTVQVPISIRHCWPGADSPDVVTILNMP